MEQKVDGVESTLVNQFCILNLNRSLCEDMIFSTKWAEEYLCLAPAQWHLTFKKTVKSANIIIIWLYS